MCSVRFGCVTLTVTLEYYSGGECAAGLQIRVIGCCVAVPHSYWSAVPTPLFIYISQLLRDSFSISQQPPIWEPPSHYSMAKGMKGLWHCGKC